MSNALYHPFYADHLTDWLMVEDVCGGERKVKAKKETYLPRLHLQSDAEYDKYQRRATFFGATKRTREALIGMLLRKAPKVTVPAGDVEKLTADIDLEGGTVKNWVRAVCAQVVSTGRACTIIDFSETENRPYLSFYPAVNVVNWHEERRNGRKELVLLTLKENTETREGSTVAIKEEFREYTLLENGTVQVVVKRGGKNGEILEDAPTIPLRRGKPLKRIPAVPHNASHLGWGVGEIPLLDIANLNIHLYMASADIWNGRHVAGVPTPWATGVDKGGDPLILGTAKAWTTEDPQAKFGFLEFTGQGLDSLKAGIEELKSEMATLGARLLFDSKKDAESFDTVKLRAVAETAALSNMSGFLTATLTQALRWLIWWESAGIAEPTDIDPKMGVIVNDDFVETPLDPTQLAGLVAAFQADCISFETFFHQLSTGEIYPADWDLEKEIAAIAQRPPATVPALPEPPVPDPKNPKPDPAAN